jgi:Predicted membrane protein
MLLGLTLWQLLFLLEFLLKLISLFLLVSNRRKLRPLNFLLYVLAIIFLPFVGSIYVLILLKKIKGVRTLCLLLFLTLHAVLSDVITLAGRRIDGIEREGFELTRSSHFKTTFSSIF